MSSTQVRSTATDAQGTRARVSATRMVYAAQGQAIQARTSPRGLQIPLTTKARPPMTMRGVCAGNTRRLATGEMREIRRKCQTTTGRVAH